MMATRSQTLKTPTKLSPIESPARSLKTPVPVHKSPRPLRSPVLNLNQPAKSLTLSQHMGNILGTLHLFIGSLSSTDKGVRRMPPALKALITFALAALCMFIYIPKLQTESTAWFSVFSTLLPQPPCPPLPETRYPDLASVPRQYPQPHKFRRGRCRCVGVHKFVILSMQRSGSGWFETLLNNHSAISSNGEIFSGGKGAQRRVDFATLKTHLDTVFNLDWKSSAAKDSCTEAVGFKWMLNQGPLHYSSHVAQYIVERQVSVIVLLRRNLLKRLVSIKANAHDKLTPRIGRHKSHVHGLDEAEKLAEYRPTLKVGSLVRELEGVYGMGVEALRVFNETRLSLQYYEDVVNNSQLLEEVQRFLGVEVRALHSRQVKIHTKSLKQQVGNWEEVFRTLNGTQFQDFLTEDAQVPDP